MSPHLSEKLGQKRLLRTPNPLSRGRMTLAVGIGGLLLCAGSAAGDVIYQQDFENWDNSDGLWSKNTQASLGGTYTNVLGRFGSEAVSLVIQAPVGQGGSEPGGGMPFNITLSHYQADRTPVALPESTGGPQGGSGGGGSLDGPMLNLGGAISDGTNPGQSAYGPGTYSLHFDLMVFDSWDGLDSAWGPDTFSVGINGKTVFDEVMGYSNGWEYRVPDEFPDLNAFDDRWSDSIYRDIEIVFEITELTESFFFEFAGHTNQELEDESWGLDNIRIERLVDGLGFNAPEVPAPSALMVLTGGLGFLGRRKRS